jgi:hypothetical protein
MYFTHRLKRPTRFDDLDSSDDSSTAGINNVYPYLQHVLMARTNPLLCAHTCTCIVSLFIIINIYI